MLDDQNTWKTLNINLNRFDEDFGLTIPTRMPEAKDTWLSVAKAPLRSVGDTSWMYSGFKLITRPQNRPNTSRPRMRTSNDSQALDADIRHAPTTERQFTIKMELRLDGGEDVRNENRANEVKNMMERKSHF